jgi:hypothetical protein
MCNCGRKAPQTVTSVQAAQEEAALRAENAAINNAAAILSAQRAIGNASSGWVAAPVESEVPADV